MGNTFEHQPTHKEEGCRDDLFSALFFIGKCNYPIVANAAF